MNELVSAQSAEDAAFGLGMILGFLGQSRPGFSDTSSYSEGTLFG
jgi:hypothetical protein